ncbi:hypothetical protein [Cyanobium sp. Lug-B]|uniref:hypothetical protein n=1 Tax=Cyanobium sp. Lug-B TaxID=2823716 RepID=UPI0020CC1EC7|nr:hypothetical protein [Cyanobium sp. Lug-B]MCP9798915.1 hypothetical protein [Cyanobium sp. Lug-B]
MLHTSIRLPPALLAQVEALALHHRCRPANVLRHVLEIGVTALIEQLPPSPRRY